MSYSHAEMMLLQFTAVRNRVKSIIEYLQEQLKELDETVERLQDAIDRLDQ